MTLNSIKIRIEKLSKSKRKFHVFTINEERDSAEKKAEIYQQIEELKKQGIDPLLIIVRTMTGPDDLEKE
jgi:hypothetical protein